MLTNVVRSNLCFLQQTTNIDLNVVRPAHTHITTMHLKWAIYRLTHQTQPRLSVWLWRTTRTWVRQLKQGSCGHKPSGWPPLLSPTHNSWPLSYRHLAIFSHNTLTRILVDSDYEADPQVEEEEQNSDSAGSGGGPRRPNNFRAPPPPMFWNG